MIALTWTQLKAILDQGVPYKYFDIDGIYYIFGVDDPLIFATQIVKDGGADQVEFDANYKDYANRTIAKSTGRSKVAIASNNHTSNNISTSAYTQLIASTTDEITRIQVFDSSGQILVLAVGAAASEVDQIYIFQGGTGEIDLFIPEGSRISAKAITANTTRGYLLINFLK